MDEEEAMRVCVLVWPSGREKAKVFSEHFIYNI